MVTLIKDDTASSIMTDIINNVQSKMKTGMAFMPMPTAFGKSYTVHHYLLSASIENTKKYKTLEDLPKLVMVAPQQKLLDDDILNMKDDNTGLVSKLNQARKTLPAADWINRDVNKRNGLVNQSAVLRLVNQDQMLDAATKSIKISRDFLDVKDKKMLPKKLSCVGLSWIEYHPKYCRRVKNFNFYRNLFGTSVRGGYRTDWFGVLKDRGALDRLKVSFTDLLKKMIEYDKSRQDPYLNPSDLEKVHEKRTMAYHRMMLDFKRANYLVIKTLNDRYPDVGLMYKSKLTGNLVVNQRKAAILICLSVNNSVVHHFFPWFMIPLSSVVAVTADRLEYPVSLSTAGRNSFINGWLRPCNHNCPLVMFLDEISEMKDCYNSIIDNQVLATGAHLGAGADESGRYDITCLTRFFYNTFVYNLSNDQMFKNVSDSNARKRLLGFYSQGGKKPENKDVNGFLRFVKLTGVLNGFFADKDLRKIGEAPFQQMFIHSDNNLVQYNSGDFSNVSHKNQILAYCPSLTSLNKGKVVRLIDVDKVTSDINDYLSHDDSWYESHLNDVYLELSSVIASLQDYILNIWHKLYRAGRACWPDVSVDDILDNLFYLDNSQTPGNFLKNNLPVMFTGMAHGRREHVVGNFYYCGFSLFSAAAATNKRLNLDWIDVNSTAESHLLRLSQDNLVFGLSADLEYPTNFGHFNYAWLKANLTEKHTYIVKRDDAINYQKLLKIIDLKNKSYKRARQVAPKVDNVLVQPSNILSSLDNQSTWLDYILNNSDLKCLSDAIKLFKKRSTNYHKLINDLGVFLGEPGKELKMSETSQQAFQLDRGHFDISAGILNSVLDFCNRYFKFTHHRYRSMLILSNREYSRKQLKAFNTLISKYLLLKKMNKISKVKVINTGKMKYTALVNSSTFKKTYRGNSTYASNWDRLKAALAVGDLKFVFSTYGSITHGVNLTYPIPKDLQQDAVSLLDEKGYLKQFLGVRKGDVRLSCKDFDGVYLAAPTYSTISLGKTNDYGIFDSKASLDAFRRLFESGEMLNGSVPDITKDQLGKALSHFMYLKLNRRENGQLITPPHCIMRDDQFGLYRKDMETPINSGWNVTRTIMQALDRLNRSLVRVAPLMIYVDSRMISKNLKFDELRHQAENIQQGKESYLSFPELNPIESVFLDGLKAYENDRSNQQMLMKLRIEQQNEYINSQVEPINQSLNVLNKLFKKYVVKFDLSDREKKNKQALFDFREEIVELLMTDKQLVIYNSPIFEHVVDKLWLIVKDTDLPSQGLRKNLIKHIFIDFGQINVIGYQYELTSDQKLDSLAVLDGQSQLSHELDFSDDGLRNNLYDANLLNCFGISNLCPGRYIVNPLIYKTLFRGQLAEDLMRNQLWKKVIGSCSELDCFQYYRKNSRLYLPEARETFDGALNLSTCDHCVMVDFKDYSEHNLMSRAKYLAEYTNPKVEHLKSSKSVNVSDVVYINLYQPNDNSSIIDSKVQKLNDGSHYRAIFISGLVKLDDKGRMVEVNGARNKVVKGLKRYLE